MSVSSKQFPRLVAVPLLVGVAAFGPAGVAHASQMADVAAGADSTLNASEPSSIETLSAKYLTSQAPADTVTPAAALSCVGAPAMKTVVYKVDGRVVDHLQDAAREGSKVSVEFQLAAGCTDVQVGLAVYSAPSSSYDESKIDQQKLVSHQTGTFGADGKTHTLEVTVVSCDFQVDFFTGAVLDNLTAADRYGAPEPRLIDTATGGTKVCDVLPVTAPVQQDQCPADVAAHLLSHSYTINGVAGFRDLSTVKAGDRVQVDFTVAGGCADERFSLVSYEAPTGDFDRDSAGSQLLFDSATGHFGPGQHSLSIRVPGCFFQVDFVRGDVLDKFGPGDTNNFYGDQGRLIDSDNGGATCVSSLPETETPSFETPLAVPVEVLAETVQPESTAQLAQTGTESGDLALLASALTLLGAALGRAASRVKPRNTEN